MNAVPHIHEVRVRRRYDSIGKGGWRVEYGDTVVRFASFRADPYSWSESKFDRKVGKAVRKAVQQHDRGSIEAGQREERQRRAREQLKEYARSEWATPEKVEAAKHAEKVRQVHQLIAANYPHQNIRQYMNLSEKELRELSEA